MAVQVFGPGRQKPTFGQKLGAGFEKALGIVGEYHKEEKAKALQAKDRAATGSYLESLGFENASQWPADFQKKMLEEHGATERELRVDSKT